MHVFSYAQRRGAVAVRPHACMMSRDAGRHQDAAVFAEGSAMEGTRDVMDEMTPTESPLSKRRGRCVFISAAEPSADLHAAALIRAAHEIDPTIEFVGVAGPRMQEAGCVAVYDMTAHAAMLAGMFRVVPRAIAMLGRSRAWLRGEGGGRRPEGGDRRSEDRGQKSEVGGRRPDLAVVVDSPLLHLRTAKYAYRAGVPVLYFIAPQVWAWGERRISRIRRYVRRMAVILPFEEEYFKKHGIDAQYVGNPLFDTLVAREVDKQRVDEIRGQAGGRKTRGGGEDAGKYGSALLESSGTRGAGVALLPGSRAHVVKEVFPGQVEVAEAIAKKWPATHFCVSAANDRAEAEIRLRLEGRGLSWSLHRGENGELLTACRLALVASGTATLETAFYHAPMIVMYNAPRWSYYLVGKWLLRINTLSLVNIIAGRHIVPEFMPFYRSTQPIIETALELFGSDEHIAQMRENLRAMMEPLIKTGASRNAARMVVEMLEERQDVKATGKRE